MNVNQCPLLAESRRSELGLGQDPFKYEKGDAMRIGLDRLKESVLALAVLSVTPIGVVRGQSLETYVPMDPIPRKVSRMNRLSLVCQPGAVGVDLRA